MRAGTLSNAPARPAEVNVTMPPGMVDAIWAEMGLCFPPKVEQLPRQARSTVADANRLSIRLPDTSPSWWLLHELAHAMTSTHDGRSDGHGPEIRTEGDLHLLGDVYDTSTRPSALLAVDG
jgi:hypothetical protein